MLLRINIILLLIFLTSCASEGLIQSEQEINIARQEALNTNKSPESLLNEYENKLAAFTEESLAFYAPLNFQQASERVIKAKKQLKNLSPQTINFELISALRYIDKAVSNKQAVKLHLKKADTHFTVLQTLQAPTLSPVEFSKIKDSFKKLNKLIENGKVQEAIKQEPDLIKDMIQVEIETLKTSHLGESIKLINQAKENNAENYAPASLKEAENLLDLTQAFIQKSYRDRSTILQKSEETLKAAKKLYYISKEALAIHKSSYEEIEKKVINAYSFLRELETNLSIKPIDIAEYSEQSTELLKQLKTKELENKKEIEALLVKIDKPLPVITPKAPALIEPKESELKTIMSQETNKAVLPELFTPNTYSDKNEIEEDLEFDSVEIVK